MGKDLPYCILFLSYFIFVSSNLDKDSQVDVFSQGFERETEGINNHETIAERVCNFVFNLAFNSNLNIFEDTAGNWKWTF